MASFSLSPTTTTSTTTTNRLSSSSNYQLHKHSPLSSSSTSLRLDYHVKKSSTNYSPPRLVVLTKCNPSNDKPENESYANSSGTTSSYSEADNSKLKIGSAIIVVEAPKIIKSATSMPSLIVNSGLVKPGDVGRIVARKPKDVWAVRLKIGSYLIDGKYFRPLDINE